MQPYQGYCAANGLNIPLFKANVATAVTLPPLSKIHRIVLQFDPAATSTAYVRLCTSNTACVSSIGDATFIAELQCPGGSACVSNGRYQPTFMGSDKALITQDPNTTITTIYSYCFDNSSTTPSACSYSILFFVSTVEFSF